MPRYAYQKPVNRLYSYNLDYMNNYYKPQTHYIEKKKDVVDRDKRAPSEQPGHQSLAERLKTFPMDGSIFRARASSVPPSRRQTFDCDEELFPKTSKAYWAELLDDSSSTAVSSGRRARPMSTYETSARNELRRIDPIWFRHPWDWDCVWVPPHENTTRPYFGVGTNTNLIRRFLTMRPVHYDESRHVPIWMKHPYRLPVEDIVVPPHESSIWPETVPHFNLVSSYDAMIGYLGLKR